MSRSVLAIELCVPTKQPHGNFGGSSWSSGLNFTAEHRARISSSLQHPSTQVKLRAKRHTDISRAKISAAMCGKLVTTDRQLQVRKQKKTAETCARMKKARRIRDPIGTRKADIDPHYRAGLDLNIWREAVYARDSFICQHCNKVGGTLNAHHVKPWAKFPALRFEIDNGITLCVPCHKAEHKRMRAEAKQ